MSGKKDPDLEQENSHTSLRKEMKCPESDRAAGTSPETEPCRLVRPRAITFRRTLSEHVRDQSWQRFSGRALQQALQKTLKSGRKVPIGQHSSSTNLLQAVRSLSVSCKQWYL